MPDGFFVLTLLLTTAVTLPLRVRLGVSLALSDMIAFPAAVVLVIEALSTTQCANQLRALYRANRAVFWYLGWSGAAAVIGLVRSTDSLKVYKDLVPGAVLYILVGLTATSARRVSAVLLATLPGILCHLVLAIPQGLFGAPYVTPTSSILEWKMDIYGEILANVPVGLFTHPNGLALFLMPVMLFALAQLGPASARARPLIAALVIAVAWVLWMTQARGVYAFTAMGLILVFLPPALERWRLALAIVLPLVTIAAIILFTLATVESLDAGDGTQYGTVVTRVTLLLGGLQLIASDTFTQIFGNGYPLFDKFNYTGVVTPNAHNAWINQILSFGLPSLAFYLASFVSALHKLCRWLDTRGGPRGYALGAVAALATILGDNFFEPSDRGEVHAAQILLLFAIAAAIPAVATDRRVVTSERGTPPAPHGGEDSSTTPAG